jgi:altronate hydrolase
LHYARLRRKRHQVWSAHWSCAGGYCAGEHIHAHNTRTNLSDLDEYRYQPDLADRRRSRRSRRADLSSCEREVGVRNELWILPTVGCVNGIARQIQNRF